MAEVVQPLLVATFAWWFSTGVLIWLVGLPRWSFRWTAMGATALMLLGTVGLIALREKTEPIHAYAGFAAGLALWAWHEAMFLLGYISGPRRGRCPQGLKTWPRFLVSAQTIIHHEIGIAVHGAIILALSWGAENQFAAWTYLLLWGMRLNAKFVVFLGAPNISDHFLPAHLTYLSSYFGKRRVTAFFPFLITLATAAATALAYQAVLLEPGSFAAIGVMLLATLAALAVLEHWALVLPVPDGALWSWAQRKPKPEHIRTQQHSGGPDGL